LIVAARIVCYRAATVKDRGVCFTLFSALAKLYSSVVAVR
jgi:hypothetical protein